MVYHKEADVLIWRREKSNNIHKENKGKKKSNFLKKGKFVIQMPYSAGILMIQR